MKKQKTIKIKTIEDIFKHLTEENKERFFMDFGLYIHYVLEAKRKWADMEGVKFKYFEWLDDGLHKISGVKYNGQKFEIEGKNKIK